MVPVLLLSTTFASMNSPLVIRLCPPPVDMVRGWPRIELPKMEPRVQPPPGVKPGPLDTLIATIETRLTELRSETDAESADTRRETIKALEQLLDECKKQNEQRK